MKRPFGFLFIFLVLGVLLQRIVHLQVTLFGILLLFCAASLLSILFKGGRAPGLALLMIILGVVVQYHADEMPSRLPLADNQYEKVTMELLTVPRERKWYWEVDVRILSVAEENTGYTIHEKSRLQIPKTEAVLEELKPGYLLEARQVKVISRLTQRPLEDYEVYLRSKGILHIIRLSAHSDSRVAAPEGASLILLSGRIKSRIENFLDRSISVPQVDLMKSILFGNQGYLNEEMLDAFSKSGTAHIVAVSGLHIGIIVLILEKLLSFFSVGRNQRLIITLLFIGCYGFLVGLPISIVRAGLMYGLYVLAYFVHRRYDSINGLMFIAFISILWNPFTLYTVSFQLSFGATLSILLFYPIIAACLNKLPGYIRGLLSVTLAAQLGTIPIILYHFQQISLISIGANLLIVPLLGVLLTLALAAIGLGTLWNPLGIGINQLTNLLLTYIYKNGSIYGRLTL